MGGVTVATTLVGIFGGSGLYQLLDDAREVVIDTPFGPPSDSLWIGDVAGRQVAFMPRHGRGHIIPPHRINYRANLYAMQEVGATRILGPCAVGSLQPALAPGDVVIADQFVDRTWGRPDTFWEGPVVNHLSAADPYCPELGRLASEASRGQGARVHQGQTMVVVQGPRFSSRAESRWYRSQGWGIIGMTGYPEVVLARELGLCYASVAVVTDYDSGLEGSPNILPVSHEEVLRVFAANVDRLRALLLALVASLPDSPGCECRRSRLAPEAGPA
ncbi:MAG: S-methyl-5'-thioadenosine phosphorylase [Candidatus Dormibacteria bacterium]